MLHLFSGNPAPAAAAAGHKKTPTRAILWEFSLARADNSHRVQLRPGRSHQPFPAVLGGDSIPSYHLQPRSSPRPQPCILYQPRSRVSRGARLSGHPADRTGRRHLLDAEIGGRKGQAYADAANGALEAWAILTTVLAQAVWFASSPLTSITEHPPLRRAISGVRPPPQSVGDSQHLIGAKELGYRLSSQRTKLFLPDVMTHTWPDAIRIESRSWAFLPRQAQKWVALIPRM